MIKNAGYNADIAPGQTVSFGFSGNGGSKELIPSNYKVHEYGVPADSEYVDDNGNGIPDLLEDYSNWDTLEDTDADGMPDLMEIWLESDPASTDSDEDLDDDGLTNSEEGLNSHPLFADTDSDGLNDYDETCIYLTDPNLKDTDNDGAYDEWELDKGYDPRTYNESFSVSGNVAGTNITAAVSLEVDGSIADSLLIEPADDMILLDTTIPGYIGSPFRFEIDGDFSEATISFSFDEKYLADENFVPTIYYYNEETQLLEEMPTTLDGNTASTTTTHFSVYVLLDKTTYEAAWSVIKEPNVNSNVEQLNIGFVVDTSGSMSKSEMTTAKTVIKDFITEISSNKIETNVALVRFASSASVVCELTTDYDTFINKLDALGRGGGTDIASV